MKFVRPNWVIHQAGDHDRKKRQAIFTLDVHPDGTRLATGGIDAIIRIWTTTPILNNKFELNSNVPKQLSTLDQHSGPILSLRWSNSGRYLASASDDRAIIIWSIDPNGGGKVFGSSDFNIEGWKAERVLSGHDSDVTEIAWSSDDRYLASVAMDGNFMVHDMRTFNRIVKISGHDSSIKGVGFDPAGHYLATASDDKSLKVWRTSDWGLEYSITEPFIDSPRAFVRRLSWSPDGANIIAANAINDTIFVAAIINRNDFSSQTKLVGHENSVLCTSFNPCLFNDKEKNYAICAVGSTDSVISVWKTNSMTPLVVVKDVFERQVLDLSWSNDGHHLYACSADGSTISISFSDEELGDIVNKNDINQMLQNYPKPTIPLPAFGVPPPIQQQHPPTSNMMIDRPSQLTKQPSQLELMTANERPQPSTSGNPSKKKRIAPTLVQSLPGGPSIEEQQRQQQFSNNSNNSDNNVFNPPIQQQSQPQQQYYQPQYYQPSQQQYYQPPPQMTFNPPVIDNRTMMPMTLPHPSNPNVVGYWLPYITENELKKNKDKDYDDDDDDDENIVELDPTNVKISNIPSGLIYRNVKARTLGNTVKRPEIESNDIKVIETIPQKVILNIPNLKSFLNITFSGVGGSSKELDRVEVRNQPELNKYEILMYSKRSDSTSVTGKVIWVDYSTCGIISVVIGNSFVACTLENGSIRVLSFSGRKIFPDLMLDSICSILLAEGNRILAISSCGVVYEWDVKLKKLIFDQTSISALMDNDISIKHVLLRPNGVPVIILDNGTAHAYDYCNLKSWNLISCVDYTKSDNWDSRGRSRQSITSASMSTQSQHHYQQQIQNPMSTIEIMLNEMLMDGSVKTNNNRRRTKSNINNKDNKENENNEIININGDNNDDADDDVDMKDDEREEENVVWTLNHLENKISGCILLESPVEFKNTVIAYARRLSDEGFRGKAEEFLREYIGPIFNNLNNDGSNLNNNILGYKKREIAKEFASILSKGRLLNKLGNDHIELLKQINAEIL